MRREEIWKEEDKNKRELKIFDKEKCTVRIEIESEKRLKSDKTVEKVRIFFYKVSNLRFLML